MNSFFDLFKSPSKNNNKTYNLSSSMDSISEPRSALSSPSLNSSTSPSLNSSTEDAFMRTTSSPSIDIPKSKDSNRESSYFRMLQVVETSSF